MFFKKRHSSIYIKGVAALFLAAAISFSSCSKEETMIEEMDLTKIPVQVINNMNALQSDGGVLQSKMSAPRMEKYQTDTTSYELFPEGFNVFSYTSEGELETTIVSQGAKHTTTKDHEEWVVYGNVLIKNHIKGERMETDTLYWDMEKSEIFTDCYVKMWSQDGFLQGFGMRSDEKASNAIILRPFDSYGNTISYTNSIYLDSLNFIGPTLY